MRSVGIRELKTHLASFAEVLRGLQGRADVRFSSFDDRLNRAARRLSRTLR